MSYNEFIYGSSPLDRIVSCEVEDTHVNIYRQLEDGSTETRQIPYKNWILSNIQRDESWLPLDGALHFKYLKFFRTKKEMWCSGFRNNNENWKPYDLKEAAMLMTGFTYYKNLTPKQLSVLSFDIETTGLVHNQGSKVLLISNTFRVGDKIIRRLFSYDEYETQGEMLLAWSEWVRQMDPPLVIGHNIYQFDLPYMAYCASMDGVRLHLGRDGSEVEFEDYQSKFRKGGSQFLHYHNVLMYGREVVDTMHLALKYDQATRKYVSYGLKNIIAQENLERKDRVFYDASQIHRNYQNPEEFKKIKAYAEMDADDALALWDLMGSAYFYLNRSIPKSFQAIINGATGSQLNSFLVRSYLTVGHSLPLPDDKEPFQGAISIGNPGVYKNVFKVDVASLYPSIMLVYNIYDRNKDPLQHFQKTVKFFTEERLSNKAKAKETGDRYYKDVEQAQKIVINSLYGLLGANGLHFNSPEQGALVTQYGREILKTAIKFATGQDYERS